VLSVSAETLDVEMSWSLALVIKSVVTLTAGDADSEPASIAVAVLLQQQQFVESVSYMARLGTGLSRKWIVEDLEVIDIRNQTTTATRSLAPWTDAFVRNVFFVLPTSFIF